MNRMSPADRAAWKSARSLADLGDLTARWLEGEVRSQPGYAAGCGPDQETVPLVPLLARLNRAGFVTTGSQPGKSGPGYDGAHWEQRAAVEGFAEDPLAARLIGIARGAGMLLGSGAVTVTRRDGEHYTRFGVHRSRRDIKDPHAGYGICHRDAVRALCSSQQVTVIDPQWGRQDMLWHILDNALQSRTPGGAW